MENQHLMINKSPVILDLINYSLKGDPIINQLRRLKDLKGVFQNEEVFNQLDQEQLVYTVQSWLPVEDGTPGGLYFGASTLYPGKVDNEYFMTKGHFHAQADRAEFYWGVRGRGMLILMDRNRNTWAEEVFPGSLHYIGSKVAHRLANTGNDKLIVGACWPSDAGHNYEEIADNGFSARLVESDGKPILI
ncbi:MAG: glucose-6-phosphate isomerase [Bacteroidales bacterium]|nr:glucose-6-phosphate isomerase [Bacteroidales bacterium]